jgi:hypothetical protein
MGYYQSFDDNNGKVALISGRECWQEIQDGVLMADSFVRTKLAKLEDRGFDLHQMGLPSSAEYDQMVADIPNYSDGLTLITRW